MRRGLGQPHVTSLTLNRLGQREIAAIIDARRREQGAAGGCDGGHRRAHRRHSAVRGGDDEGGAGGGERGRGPADGRGGSVSGPGGPRKLARLADGAARPARPRQGGGADRGGDRAGVLPRPAGCGGAQARGGVGDRRSTVSFRQACCSGRARRRRRATCSSTRWCKTRPMARCCASRDARFTLGSPKPLKANSPRSAESQPEVLARHCAEAGNDRKSRSSLGEGRAAIGAALGFGRSGGAAQTRARPDQILTRHARAYAAKRSSFRSSSSTPLLHVQGYAAPETRAAVERARLLIEQAEALGEPPEDPLLLFSVLYGFGSRTLSAFNGDVMRELAVAVLGAGRKAERDRARQ